MGSGWETKKGGEKSEKKVFNGIGVGDGVFVSVLIGDNGSTRG